MKKCITNNEEMGKLVTVIIPYYNNKNTIIRALESVLNQSYKNLEIILINDGSKDNSYDIVKDYLCNNYIKMDVKNLTQENSGPSKARNKGIKLAKGEFIAFLDADDSWESYKIERQMEIINSNPSIDLLGCNFWIVNSQGKKHKKYFIEKSLVKINFKNLLYKHYYATPCVIAKKEVLIKCGMFNEQQKHMEDSLLFTKIARDFNAYMSNDFLVNTYKNSFGESGLSGQLNEMQKYEFKNFKLLYKENNKSKENMSIGTFILCNIFSSVKFLRRKVIVLIRK